MRHLVSGRKLNRTASHRKAMLGNLAMSLFDKERVITTVAKAKEARSLVDRLITYAKSGTLHDRRNAGRIVRRPEILKKLFDTIAPMYKGREGGYTRIVRVGERRGDNAMTVIFELVGRARTETPKPPPAATTKKGKKSAQPASPAAEASGEAAGEEKK